MPARSNAMSELTRFWLESRHGCVVRESVPVPVKYGLSDIDLLALRPDSTSFELPSGVAIGPRVIVETKDEHDWEATGKNFGKRLAADMEKLGNNLFITAEITKPKFVMLRQQHYEVARDLFGCDDFDRLFIVHALDDKIRQKLTPMMQKKRIHWLTVREMLTDLESWYRKHQRPSGLRNTLIGDLFHLLFGYCNVSAVKEELSKITVPNKNLKIFIDDDKSYLQWLSRNPSGYVLNSHRKPVRGHIVLHRAKCGTIMNPTRGPGNWTTTGYIKICSLNKSELKKWAENNGQNNLSYCQVCKP